MRAPKRFGVVAVLVIAAQPAISRGQSLTPPCPPGTTLAAVQAGATDTDVLPTPSDLTATHHADFDAMMDFSGAPASEHNDVTITPPDGVQATTVPGDGSPDVAEVQFVAPSSPGTITFTVTWTQSEGFPSNRDCTASRQVPVDVGADLPNRVSRVFAALQHWAGHPGSPENVLSVGWSLRVDRHRGDGEPVTVTARAVRGRRLPDASTPELTSSWSPFHLHRLALTTHSNLIRLRSATAGADAAGDHLVDIITASVLVFPPRRGATVHRGIAVDVTQGATVLARYRLITTCRLRRHLTCKPI